MTAISLQQNGAHRQQYSSRASPHSSNGASAHQSRPQSFTASPAMGQAPRQDPAGLNVSSAVMSPRPAVSNDPVQVVNGNSNSVNGEAARDLRLSLQTRPISAADSSQDDSERERPKRRPKPLLQRSKSDYGPRGEEQETQPEEDIQDWGARHGFEDHYASEEYVSQLANVGCSFFCSRKRVAFAIATVPLHGAHAVMSHPYQSSLFGDIFFENGGSFSTG